MGAAGRCQVLTWLHSRSHLRRGPLQFHKRSPGTSKNPKLSHIPVSNPSGFYFCICYKSAANFIFPYGKLIVPTSLLAQSLPFTPARKAVSVTLPSPPMPLSYFLALLGFNGLDLGCSKRGRQKTEDTDQIVK